MEEFRLQKSSVVLPCLLQKDHAVVLGEAPFYTLVIHGNICMCVCFSKVKYIVVALLYFLYAGR